MEDTFGSRTPAVDKRKKEDIFREMKEFIRAYTPEWNTEAEGADSGIALMRLISELYGESINKINHLYDRHKIQYLNRLGAKMQTGIPARGVVAFEAANPAGGAIVKKGTAVLAESEEGTIRFETLNEVFVSGAEINGIYETSRKSGKTLCILGNEEAPAPGEAAEEAPEDEYKSPFDPFELFEFEGQEGIEDHYLAFCSKNVFDVRSGNEITVCPGLEPESDHISCLADPERVSWYYAYAEEGGETKLLPFDGVRAEKGRIILTKGKGRELKPAELEGEESIWIVLKANKEAGLPNIITKSVLIETSGSGIRPDSIYTDSEQRPRRFYPFGDPIEVGSECYIACEEAFCKKGAKIHLDFNLDFEKKELRQDLPQMEIIYKYIMKEKPSMIMPEPVNIFVDEAVLEYFNGTGWARIYLDEDDVTLFNTSRSGNVRVSFTCPGDMAVTEYGMSESAFIRFRMVRSENLFRIPANMYIPVMENFTIGYGYDAPVFPDRTVLMDNTEKRDITADFMAKKSISLFNRPRELYPTMYLSLTGKPTGAPISIYFDIKPCIGSATEPKLRFEYSTVENGMGMFKDLKASDMTDGLSHSGIIMFIPPEDFMALERFGKKGYYLKITDELGEYERFGGKKPLVAGIYLNAAYVSNIERVENEEYYVDIPDSNLQFKLSGENIFDITVRVDERELLTDAEKETLAESDAGVVREFDYAGNEMGFWVPWKRVENFYGSTSNDRHYILDPNEGMLYFGDGVNGKIPPASDKDVIRVDFSSSHGKNGNLEVGGIYRLDAAVPGVKRVYNPVPTHGGCNTESIDAVAERIISGFDHFDYAVSERDYEKIIKSSARDICRVRCIGGMNIFGEPEEGAITIAVLMNDYKEGSHAFSSRYEELRNVVKRHIPVTVPLDSVVISEPLFVEISALISAEVDDMQDAYFVQQEIQRAVGSFIDMQNGGFGGKGFEIGDIPTESKIRSYLRMLNLPCRVKEVILTGAYIKDGVRYEHELTNRRMPFAAGINGKHHINIV